MNSRRSIAVLVTLLVSLVMLCWWPRSRVAAPTPAGTDAAHSTTGITDAAHAAIDTPTTTTATGPDTDLRTNAPARRTFAIHGFVTCRGVPVPERAIIGRRPRSVESRTRTAVDGAYRLSVAPGRYLLLVPAVGTWQQQIAYSRYPSSVQPAAEHRIEVRDRDVRCDFELPSGTIAIRTLNARTFQPITGTTVVSRPPPPHLSERHIETNAAGSARFEEVTAGKHEVSASARGYRETTIELEVGDQTASADLRLEPTGALDIVLVDELGTVLEITAKHRVHVLNPMTSRVLEPTRRAYEDQPRPTVFEYDDIMAGTYWVGLPGDSKFAQGKKSIRFQPVESDARAEVEVLAGKVSRVRIPVRSRCYAELIGLDHERQDATGSLRLERLDPVSGTVRVLPSGRSSRTGPCFEGYLASGTYSLIFTSGERTWRESLVVDREPIKRSFTLPW